MKRLICIIMIMFSLTLLSGCQSIKNFLKTTPDSTSSADSENTKITPLPKDDNTPKESIGSDELKAYYFPKENTKYVYQGKGMEYASYTLSVDFIKDSLIQVRTNNGGTELCKVLQVKDGELKLILSREECYYREDLTSKPANKDEVLLKAPLVKGTSWTLSDGRKRYISNTDVDVTTPSGNYKAIEVTTEDNDSKTLDYYSLNTGLVKTLSGSKGAEVSSTLSKITDNSPLIQAVKFYYPNINDSKLYFTKKSLSFNTNDISKITFEKNFKEAPNNELGKLLGPDVKIKVLYLNKDNKVYADFSKDFVTEMNTGSGYEQMVLQCITNTLGSYYGVDKVYITIEGNPYSSGHIAMKKGEAFTVNTKNSVELKSK